VDPNKRDSRISGKLGFKGLESPIVILWGLDTIDLSHRQELLYVGMSRAKSLRVIVGRAATCAAFKDVANL